VTNSQLLKTVLEPAKEVPVMGKWDVAVCGGGPAGCAAAIASARNGAETLLIEKDGFSGGAAVSQLVSVILSTNGVDFQGVWHEWIHALRRRNGVSEIRKSPHVISGTVYPECIKYAWDELLKKAGVKILYHSTVSEVLTEARRIKALFIETSAGRRAILADRVIDCTGDGIVCHKAGVPWEQGDGSSPWAMALTKVFRVGGAVRPELWPAPDIMAEIEKALRAAMVRGEFATPIVREPGRLLNYIRDWAWELPGRNQIMSVVSRVLKTDPLDPWQMTRAEQEGRLQAWEAAEVYRRFVPGCENSYLLDTSNNIGVRSSRRIKGMELVTKKDVLEFRTYPDEVARSSWHIDIWPADSYTKPAVLSGTPDSKKRAVKISKGAYFGIRYGCLLAYGVENLLMAGRCISAEHIAESSLRIQQTCMATGQAAGTAAAISLKLGVESHELKPDILVRQLEKDRRAVKKYDMIGNNETGR